MGQNPQFNLAIIKADQQTPFGGDKGLTDAAPFFLADRDVLQIRIGRG